MLEAEHLCMTLRRPGNRRPHRHLGPARPAAQRPALAAGVPHPQRRRHLNHRLIKGVAHVRHPNVHLCHRRGRPGRRQAAEALRAEGFDGRLLLLGEEAERPYERPPLSKAYLRGETDRDSLYVHQDGFYAAHDIELHNSSGPLDRPGRPSARAGLRRTHRLRPAAGGHRRRPAPPRRAGAELAGVHYLRSRHDADTWPPLPPRRARGGGRDRLDRQRGRRLLRQLGQAVTLVGPDTAPLARVLGPRSGASTATCMPTTASS